MSAETMKIKNLNLNSSEEVTHKIVHEILDLFHVEFDGEFDLNIENFFDGENVETHLEFDGKKFTRSEKILPNEIQRAEVNRIIKKNLYKIFLEEFEKDPAPWGILHGVRPTKLVHRWLNAGESEKKIFTRLENDYLASEEKSRLLIEVSKKQRKILEAVDKKIVSIYIGIPFCVTRCLYCSFTSNILPSVEKISEFMSALEKDIIDAKKTIDEFGLSVQTIYIGGGTPTSLPEKFFDEMLSMVAENFYTESVEEFTVEAGRPDTISKSKIETMIRTHVSRISLNPQTMNQQTLDRIGRKHSPQNIIDSFHQLRTMTDFYINMDLILGLPGEDHRDVENTIDQILQLEPDGITIHSLALKKGSRLKMQLEDYELPSDDEVRKMYDVAVEKIQSRQYFPYYLYRQSYMRGQLENIGYTRSKIGIYNVQIMGEMQTIIGIGSAATTKIFDPIPNRLMSTFHAKDLITYLKDVDYYIEKRSNLFKTIYSREDFR